MNAHIKETKKFKNPSIYEFLIEKFGIDETGTNFPKGVFDPHAYEENCFYDKLGRLLLFKFWANINRASKFYI